jgi:predicted nucleic acid-binding protein
MPGYIVVDTMIASAWLGKRTTGRKARWAPILEPAIWVLPFAVVAEMRFGAEVGGWGPRRRSLLDRLVARARVAPPVGDITDAYVDLRTWCVQKGHGLGGKHHEADRWVAAVAIASGLPLASEDLIFEGLPALRSVEP